MGTYIALRPLVINGEVRSPGQEVPEAASWESVDAWILAGELWYRPDVGEPYTGPWPHTPASTIGMPEGLEVLSGPVEELPADVLDSYALTRMALEEEPKPTKGKRTK